MYLFFKVVIYTAVVLGYKHITNNSENSLFLDFVIIFILISLVSWLLRKIEKIIDGEKRTKAL